MLKILSKFITFVLLLSVLGAIGFFIFFPKYPEIKATVDSLNASRIAKNTTLQLLTKVSPPNNDVEVKDVSLPTSLEFVSTEDLIKLKNEGKVQFNMEDQNTSLYIPAVNIKGDVVDSENANGMERGFWHFPLSSQPGTRGNTVIIAHRFKYLPPRTDTFFLLDKVQVGDTILVDQKSGSYRYTVVQTKVVEKDSREILYNTNDYRITLVTCTPLWTADKRLVVIGKLDKIYGTI